MRCSRWWMIALALAFPASASAQGVKPVDIVGTWWGKMEYRDRLYINPGTAVPNPKGTGDWTGTMWLALWPDGVWWHHVRAHRGISGTNAGGGRWRLIGDTLWLGDDERYGAIRARLGVLRADTLDTLRLKTPVPFPTNDSTFWNLDRAGLQYTAYKISLKDQRLSLARLDKLSNNKDQPGAGVFERRHHPAYWGHACGSRAFC